MAYQSLYRRYRSGRFSELVGQQHVVTALRNAIAEERVGHAYLFSGPRGTGKTSTARILGKALNCTNLGDDGEPCCQCESCLSFESGTSYDLQELDAASNNGVEAIRDLISKVALGSPGRTKVYILDEVHMLTAGAENALLKTLEEPPDHVVFVLATTEPHKVVPTIRSRTQHYEFELIPAPELEAHVRFVADDAGLEVDEAMIDYVIRVGAGSARDTLSALDQVVAAGGIPRDSDAVDDLMAGLSASDPGAVVAAVAEALKAGREPRVIGEDLLGRLRGAFLSAMNAPLDHLSENQAAAAAEAAAQMGPAAITRSLELIGGALINMRQAPDPRVDLEVALLRLTRPELDTDLKSIVARLERLEQGGMVTAPPPTVVQPSAPPQVAPPTTADDASRPESPGAGRGPAHEARAALARNRDVGSGDDASPTPTQSDQSDPAPQPSPSDLPSSGGGSRPTLGARRAKASPQQAQPHTNADPTSSEPPTNADPTSSEPLPAAEPTSPAPGPPDSGESGPGGSVSLQQIEEAWDTVKGGLPGRAKSRFSGGRFVSVDGNTLVFGLPNAIHRDRCGECAQDVQDALAAHFGTAIDLELIIDGDAPAPTARAAEPTASKPATAQDPEPEQDVVDLDSLTDASADAAGGIDLLTEAFPGAELMDTDTDATKEVPS